MSHRVVVVHTLVTLEDVVNVPARTDLMRGRFEKGYDGRIDGLVTDMEKQIAASMEDN